MSHEFFNSAGHRLNVIDNQLIQITVNVSAIDNELVPKCLAIRVGTSVGNIWVQVD